MHAAYNGFFGLPIDPAYFIAKHLVGGAPELCAFLKGISSIKERVH